MHKPSHVLLSIWKSGAYRAASFDVSSSCGALVEHDGLGTMRRAGVTHEALEEVVTSRRAVRGGVSIKTSTLRARSDGSVEWLWEVSRPGLRREENWTIDARGHHAWQQVEYRKDRTTTYHATERGRYRGEVTSPSGVLLRTSDWKSDGLGGMKGSYSDPQGNPAGSVSYPSRPDRDNGEKVTWSGPNSEGSVATSNTDGAKSVHAVIKKEGGVTTYTTDEGDGYAVQNGSGDGRSWITITVPGKSVGKAEGDSVWVEMGSQSEAHGSVSNYTINGISHADGSSSFERTENNPTTGDKGTTFGSKDSDANFSYSGTVEHQDGSVTLTTRTIDKNGNGTEHSTVVDAQGNVVSDTTNVVKGGIAMPGAGAPAGGPGGPSDGTPTGPTPSSPDTNEPEEEPKDEDKPASPDDPKDPDKPDDSDPDEPDPPDPPEGGGQDSGRDSDDGTDDTRPGIPWGKIGHKGDGFADLFTNFGDVGSGGDDDEASFPERNKRWLKDLGGEIAGATTGTSGGGADETGWGNGGEGFRSVPLVSGSYSPPAPGADETGWGNTTDPHMLVALVATFSEAAAGMAKSGNLFSGLQR